MCPGAPMPNACGAKKALAATSTAARPTSEWKKATSSGIDVIGMRARSLRRCRRPMPAPIMIHDEAVKGLRRCKSSVVATATAMPIMP